VKHISVAHNSKKAYLYWGIFPIRRISTASTRVLKQSRYSREYSKWCVALMPRAALVSVSSHCYCNPVTYTLSVTRVKSSMDSSTTQAVNWSYFFLLFPTFPTFLVLFLLFPIFCSKPPTIPTFWLPKQYEILCQFWNKNCNHQFFLILFQLANNMFYMHVKLNVN